MPSEAFCMTLYNFLWEALEEVLVKSSRCPYMISDRSLWQDLVEILLTSSSRAPCTKILKILCLGACIKVRLDAHRKCWYEDLVSPSIYMYIEGPAAAVAIMSNLICYCSIATAACIWYIDFLPPTLFAVSCLCNLKYLGSIRLPLWGCNSCDTSGRVQECGHLEIKVSQVNSYVLPVLCLNRTRKKCAVIVKDFSVHNFGKWN